MARVVVALRRESDNRSMRDDSPQFSCSMALVFMLAALVASAGIILLCIWLISPDHSGHLMYHGEP